MNVAPQSDRHAKGHDLAYSTHRIPRPHGFIDRPYHGLLRRRIGTSNQRTLHLLPVDGMSRLRPLPPNGQRMTVNLNAELLQKPARHSACRHSGRSLPGTGALQNGADVIKAVLRHTGQVGMPRAGACYPLGVAFHRRRGHRRLPVLPIPVPDHQRYRAAHGKAKADAGEYLSPIMFHHLP